MKAHIFNYYTSKIAEIFGIEEGEIFEKSKRRDLVDARHMLYYTCSKRPMRIVYIQKYMKERGYDIGHASIVYGIEVAKKRVKSEKDYKSLIKTIESCLGESYEL